MLDSLKSCVFASWAPTIGDPTFMGWFTVGAYGATSVLAALISFRKETVARTFWALLAVTLALLAANKQLDLQSSITAIGRCIAKLQGWYEQRRAVQFHFVVIISFLSLLISLSIAVLLWRSLSKIWLALIGASVLLFFVAIRAASFHHVDLIISQEFGVAKLNWVFELSGILMIFLNATAILLFPGNRA